MGNPVPEMQKLFDPFGGRRSLTHREIELLGKSIDFRTVILLNRKDETHACGGLWHDLAP